MLRIPGWATDASLTVNGARVNVDRARGFARLERKWNPGDVVVLRLPMTPRVSTWYRQSVAVERGPLVFALRLGADWNRITSGMSKPAPAPAVDWEVRPTDAMELRPDRRSRDAGGQYHREGTRHWRNSRSARTSRRWNCPFRDGESMSGRSWTAPPGRCLRAR